jgi:predicted MFS family arabinose efflux permease
MNTTSAPVLGATTSDAPARVGLTAADEWRHGWTVVLSSAVAMILAAIPTASLGVFIAPLQEAFGWSRATLTSAILTHALCVLCLSPLVGRIINRYGARRVGLSGIIAVALAIAGVGLSGPNILSWYLAWILVGIAQTFAGPIIWSAAIVRKFKVSRGLALAVMLSGTGVATTMVAPLTLAAITAWGWRATFWAFGAGAIALCFPVIYWLFRDSAATGPVAPTRQAMAGKGPDETASDSRENWRSWRFAKLAVCSFGVALALSTLFVHMVPILKDRGMSAVAAVSVVSVLGVTQLVARLLGGHLLDRYFAPYVGAFMFALIASACLILLNVTLTLPVALLVGVLTGAGLGLELDLMAYLVSRYFGIRVYAVCYGLLLGLYGIGFGTGAVLAGAVFDHFHSYDVILGVMTIVLAGCGVLVASLGRYPDTAGVESSRKG